MPNPKLPRRPRKQGDSHGTQELSCFQEIVELAHDLKNLLLPIQAAAELLLERSLDENAKGHVRTILKQVDRMKLLVEDLLLSRNGINWRTAVNLTELVSQVARRVTEDCKVGISCLYPRIEPVYVYASETALWRVLHNLVLNAAQAAGESGKVEIRLSLDLLQKMACIEVQDSGTGIPAVHRKHVFDPFFTTKPQGTGLGLSAARRLVEQLGGDLSYRSEDGNGTIFTVWLPLA